MMQTENFKINVFLTFICIPVLFSFHINSGQIYYPTNNSSAFLINQNFDDTLDLSYFPLNVGDKFIYYYENFLNIPPTYIRYYVTGTVIKDSIIEGKRYNLCENIPSFNNLWIRVDSAENVYSYDSLNKCIFYFNENRIDSLSSSPNDTILDCVGSNIIYKCIAFNPQNIFGINTFSKEFFKSNFFAGGAATLSKVFSKNFGVTYFRSGLTSGIYQISDTYRLTGCVIKGKVYGDTNIVSVNFETSEVPNNYKLYQNYPNPFNPKTIINYQCAMYNDVSLKVFDVLGNEVSTLVNEKQNAGSYSVTFDGSNFPSGVYFYKLEAGEFSKTKRMVLLK